jgi:two-component system KDP operon response regulator KdpE
MSRILAIDDDLRVLETLIKGLASYGHQVITANSSKSGFRAACWRKVDAILLDITMPDMNGLELLKKLKSSARTMHIPVVMLTGHDNPEYKEKAGFDYAEFYVLKTADMEEVSNRLNQAISAALPKPKGLDSLFRW